MADPILTEQGDRVRHAQLDPIVVEPHDSSHAAGINAELDFVRRMHPIQLRHHNAEGVHDALVLPRAKLIVRYLGGDYVVHPRSYLLGAYGSSVATATKVGTGSVEIELSAGLGTLRYAIADCTVDELGYEMASPFYTPTLTVTRVAARISATTFRITRYEGETPTHLGAADGDFAILVYAE